MTLDEYLKFIAQTGVKRENGTPATQQELHRRMQQIIDQAERTTPQPNRPSGPTGEFADVMFKKYRG